ncbi:hypothetical protein [Bradyrhizobium sp. AZCC 2230]|uniref:hypothetical protein n=1 Tax=Bradyrhizobium sp. AZCC 2230 TaxID=3117021 RepID=UPI002FF14911
MEKLLEQLGYTTPFIYAAAAYRLFSWLDENASDKGKATLAGAMNLRDYENEEIAAALVEFFDKIYTRPLLTLRAFSRSLLFTLIATLVVLFEMRGLAPAFVETTTAFLIGGTIIAYPFNAVTDYVSLFIIRPWLRRIGTRPILALLTGTLLGFLVVGFGTAARTMVYIWLALNPSRIDRLPYALYQTFFASYPALLVFSWLPLMAVAIAIARAMNPISRTVQIGQRLLRDGSDHPLKVVGCFAAIIVFVIAMAWQSLFSGARPQGAL